MMKQINQVLDLRIREIITPALTGAGVAMVILVLLLLTPNHPEYGEWIKLVAYTMLAGGLAGGILIYLLIKVWFTSGIQKVTALVFGIVSYAFILFLNLIFAFNFVGLWD